MTHFEYAVSSCRRACSRADAAFAKLDVYEFLEERRLLYAIRLPSNEVLEELKQFEGAVLQTSLSKDDEEALMEALRPNAYLHKRQRTSNASWPRR